MEIKRIRLLLVCFELLFAAPGWGQCNLTSNYSPVVQAHYPIKKIRVMLHVLQKGNGTGNFQNTTSDLFNLNQIIVHLNGNMASNTAPSPSSGTPIADTKIRYDPYSSIQFHTNNTGTDADYNSIYNLGYSRTSPSQVQPIHNKYVINNSAYSTFEKYNYKTQRHSFAAAFYNLRP